MRSFVSSLLCICVLQGACNMSAADSWSFDSSERNFRLPGGIKVLAVIDARKNDAVPDFYTKVFRGNRLLALYPGVSFDDIVASPDGSMFVALSNGGIPGTAAVVFDAKGRLLLMAKHGEARFDYCQESITIVREWYDSENPAVAFGEHGWLSEITLRDCHGKTINLLDTVADAYNNALNSRRGEAARR